MNTSTTSQSDGQSPKENRVIYDNCKIYDLSGDLIGMCSRNKLEWYINKKIADKISDDSIKLKFEPKYINGRDNSGAVRFPRENKCYVCSSEENLVKYHVVPTEFKKLLPREWKSHNSVDILSLCRDCHDEANAIAQDLRVELEEEYKVSKDFYIDQHKYKVRSVARKLLGIKKCGVSDNKLRESLTEMVGHPASDSEIKEFAEYDISIKYKDTASPAEYIINNIIKDDKITEFIKRWKDHFVHEMLPDDLPADFYDSK